LFCPVCDGEFRSGIDRCPDCLVDLVETLPDRPADEAWEVVRTEGTEHDAALVAGLLRSRGVRSRVYSLLYHQEPVTFGALGSVHVVVPASELEAATAILAEDLLGEPTAAPGEPAPP
jgi:hypothetical protein